jgi:CTP:molybdopterin cytidylyltransferase MocA
MPPEASARDLIRRSRRGFVEVDDALAVLDIDTPEDYARWAGESAG